MYGLVCVCLQTYNTKIYGIESRKLESISFALEVLIQEVGPPVFIACDKDMYKPQLPRGDEIPRGESRSSWEGNLLESRDYLVV